MSGIIFSLRMIGITVTPSGEVSVIVNQCLSEFQSAVGGNIEMCTSSTSPELCMYVNENGCYEKLDCNLYAAALMNDNKNDKDDEDDEQYDYPWEIKGTVVFLNSETDEDDNHLHYGKVQCDKFVEIYTQIQTDGHKVENLKDLLSPLM